MLKKATLINGEEIISAQVEQGTTPRTLLEGVGLDPDLLLCRRGAMPFGQDEEIYSQISNGEKLMVASAAVVG